MSRISSILKHPKQVLFLTYINIFEHLFTHTLFTVFYNSTFFSFTYSIPGLNVDDQQVIVNGTLNRRAREIRKLLESVPKLRGILLEAPEDMEIKETMQEILKICNTNLKKMPRPEEEGTLI